VYFWPEIARCFAQVHRVLKPGGMFMITNETSGKTGAHEKWLKIVDGMSVYTGEELKSLLTGAGFARVEIDEDLAHDRLNVRAYKA
jgi:methyltransferase